GGYWWLIFPLVGVAGGMMSRWDQISRRRHRRRIELLQARTELTAAQTAARASEPKPLTKPSPLPDQLAKLFRAHDEVTRRWLQYELDVAKLIAFPAMSDGRQPLTAAFLRAKKVADGLRPASAEAGVSADAVAEYRAAVTDYEVAFDVAEREARRLKDADFSETERRRLRTAQQLLATAVDQTATPPERLLAYRRARAELDGLIALSDEAVEILKSRVALPLEQPRDDG
ncbi:hypothetical protein, partial [Microbacterium sp.]|uniref:hypothetical protein n=1 Tax=Microbacterium sp. TaxID=51671 RepID=UPI003A89FC48